MSQGKRLLRKQTAVQVIDRRSFQACRTSNRLIAAVAIIVVILITATCSVFFNLQSFSALQDLKSYGTTTDIIFSNPSAGQIARPEESDLVRKPLYVSYKLCRLIGNPGQSGLSIDLYAVDHWDTWSSPLVSDFQGRYPTEPDEIMMSTWLLKRFTQTDFHWTVPVVSALFSCAMIFVSFAMTARKVLSISPMAALRYTEDGVKRKTSRSADHATLPWMGLKNAFRHPAKAFFVIGTFFLSSVTFLLCMTVLNGLSVDKYVNFNTAHDIALYNHISRASFSPQEEQSFTPDIMAQLRQMEGVETFGVTKVVPVYEQYTEEVYGDWYQIKSDFEKSSGMEPTDPQVWIDSPSAAFWSLLVGVDSDVIAAYNESTDTPVDIDAFERGEFLLTTEMNGNGLHQGDMMTFFVMDTDQSFQLPIGGQIPLERDGMNGGAAPWLVISNEVIDQYRPDAIIYSIKIDSAHGYAQDHLDQVMSLTEHIPAISRTSKIEPAERICRYGSGGRH